MRVFSLRFLLVLSGILSANLPAGAGNDTYEAEQAPTVAALAPGTRTTYIEFRGRSAASGFGHAYVVLGGIDGAGRQRQTAVFGFVPESADDEFWSQFALPVTGAIAVSHSDFTPTPDVRYRVMISRAQYRRIVSSLPQMQKDWTRYLLVGQNCNDLVSDVARSVGLEAPLLTAQWPVDYVAELKAINTK